MKLRTCGVCGRAYPVRTPRARCPDCAHPSPTTRARGPEYDRRRSELLQPGVLCIYCGAPADTMDHVTPIAKGGDHSPANTVAACARCNASKGARSAPTPRPHGALGQQSDAGGH